MYYACVEFFLARIISDECGEASGEPGWGSSLGLAWPAGQAAYSS